MNLILILFLTILSLNFQAEEGLSFSEGHAISEVGERSRAPIHTDAIEYKMIMGEFTPPADKDIVQAPNGEQRMWSAVNFNNDGVLENPELQGGYVHAIINAAKTGPMILNAQGHSMVYVNGVPKAGDPYSRGLMPLPVMLNKGPNEFLFRVGRGRLKAQLEELPTHENGNPRAQAFTRLDDTTPDIVVNTPVDVMASVVISNFTNTWTGPTTIVATGPDGKETVNTVPTIPPLSVRKVPIQLIANAQKTIGPIEFGLTLVNTYAADPIDQRTLTIHVLDPEQTRKVTFRSDIDHSIQFYGLTPAKPTEGSNTRPGIILSLHGAGVDARRQAAAYQPKEFAHVVAPTNRREFGFDWEDWGRLDALEVLEHAQKYLATDPQRQWLTGHSMGGHGTWQLGVHHSELFSAIAPSAGWVSFSSYGGARINSDAPAASLLTATASPSETLLFTENLKGTGVYVLHGDADDNVPVSEARTMRDALTNHSDFQYFEKEGAGHWWGNECVDWPPLIEFLKSHPFTGQSPDFITLTTADPSINGQQGWLELNTQTNPLMTSKVMALRNIENARIDISTENVSRMRLFLEENTTPWAIYADGGFVFEKPGREIAIRNGAINIERQGNSWREVNSFSPHHKQPNRGGRFKNVFRNDMVFVIGTTGTLEENNANLEVATFDAETFLYRGNGSPECVLDSEFDIRQYPLRNIVLYGNADTNSAWDVLLKESPITVRRNKVIVGDREITGNDLATLMIRPTVMNSTALVAAVAGTGPAGMRLAAELPYFVSGVHYPDVTIIGSDALMNGYRGVRTTGFFGNDWKIESGKFAGNE